MKKQKIVEILLLNMNKLKFLLSSANSVEKYIYNLNIYILHKDIYIFHLYIAGKPPWVGL